MPSRVLRASALMYHHVWGPEEEPSPAPLHPDSYLSVAELSGQLDLIQRLGYRTLTLAEALGSPRKESSRREVVLTFDDGCTCFRRHVLPELYRRGMRATLFVVSGQLGRDNHWDTARGEREERLLAAGELIELEGRGVEVGSHSHSHCDLTHCGAAELEREIRSSRSALEAAIHKPVETFCYPYGHLDERVRDMVAQSGYLGAVSIYGKPHTDFGDPLAQPRMIVRPGESLFEYGLKLRGLYALWSRLPQLGLLKALRRRPRRQKREVRSSKCGPG